jgi:hypothetical protein
MILDHRQRSLHKIRVLLRIERLQSVVEQRQSAPVLHGTTGAEQ